MIKISKKIKIIKLIEIKTKIFYLFSSGLYS